MNLNFWKNGSRLPLSFLHGFGNEQRSRRSKRRRPTTAAEVLEDRVMLSAHFVFDTTYDDYNFFEDNPDAMAALEAAADILEARLGDSLDDITPEGGDSWVAYFVDPADPNWALPLNNPTIAADVIKVYVGGGDLDTLLQESGILALSAPGWAEDEYFVGDQSWEDAVIGRGESGAEYAQDELVNSNDTDFAPWGGTLSFSSEYDWNFNINSGPAEDEFDFLSIAVHELAHILGVGSADSWLYQISGDTFTGATAVAEYDGTGNVPLQPTIHGHLQGLTPNEYNIQTTDPITDYTGSEAQVAVMTPEFGEGERRDFTELDFALLKDIGWEVTTRETLTIDLDNSGQTIVIDGTVGAGTEDGYIKITIGATSYFTAAPTDTLTINGGSGNDSITIQYLDEEFGADIVVNGGAGNDFIKINAYFDLVTPVQVDIDGGSGNDEAYLFGSNYDDTVVFGGTGTGTVDLDRSDCYTDGENLEDIYVVGNAGNDTATIYDITGTTDAFYGNKTHTWLAGGYSGSQYEAYGFDNVIINSGAKSEGDTVTLYATTDSFDRFRSFPTSAVLENTSSDAGDDYSIVASNFGVVVVHNGDSDNEDQAFFQGLDIVGKQDIFRGDPTSARMYYDDPASYDTDEYRNIATGFNTNKGFGSVGNDLALFYGSSSADTYVGDHDEGHFYSTAAGFDHTADDFEQVYIHLEESAGGSFGGHDTAYIYGTAYDDVFEANRAANNEYNVYSTGANPYQHKGWGFDEVTVDFDTDSGGNDSVSFKDWSGDDTFESTTGDAFLRTNNFGTATGYKNRAIGAADFSVSFAAGGDDTATVEDVLTGDEFSAAAVDEAEFDGAGSGRYIEFSDLSDGDSLQGLYESGQSPTETIDELWVDYDFDLSMV